MMNPYLQWNRCDHDRGYAVTPVVLVLMLAGMFGVRADAQEQGQGLPSEDEAVEREEPAFHRHHVAVFLGATTGDVPKHGAEGVVETESAGGEASGETESVTEASLGFDYEYRLSRVWGVGFLFDYVGGDAPASVAGVPESCIRSVASSSLPHPGSSTTKGRTSFWFGSAWGTSSRMGGGPSRQASTSISSTGSRPASTVSTSAGGFETANPSCSRSTRISRRTT